VLIRCHFWCAGTGDVSTGLIKVAASRDREHHLRAHPTRQGGPRRWIDELTSQTAVGNR
jgi:hypothetical protein